ncbi:MAG: amidohydrolase [Nitrososphaerota archaeon]|nr:amidohydrolase [Nitrososphaerota archaeon]
MKGLLVRNCTFLDSTAGGVYCEQGRVVRLYTGGEPDVPSDTAVLDASGGTVVPGLVDTHCHPFEYGRLKRTVDLRGTSNVTGIRLRVQAGVMRSSPGEWVVGMGWDQETFPDRKMPTRRDIDDVSPANPVALSRVCGHVALLNSEALRRLGFGSRSGPEYERDAAGGLTGIVKENALTDVYGSIPSTPEKAAADLQAVDAEAARLGLTGLHCIVSPDGYRDELQALSALASESRLALRYRVYVPPESLEFVREQGLAEKLSGDKVRLNGVKIYTDGSLGARTAALRAPYADAPETSGLLRYSDEELGALVERADSLGYQAIVHAIGDRAVEQAAEALGAVAGASNPRRHRIEHAALLPSDLRSKMAKHSIRAAVQPCFVTSDTWAAERLGEDRVKDLYPFRSMLQAGLTVSGSSDSPVESLSPVLGMWAAMTRGGSVPDEALELTSAFRLYTDSARSNGFDAPGFGEGEAADFTVFDSAVAGLHPALFRKVGIVGTVAGGTFAHRFGG